MSLLALFIFTTVITIFKSHAHATEHPSIFDARVYNFFYYVQHNPSLTASQLYTPQQAAQHWQTIGIVQGLQACGSFHVLQFINNYPSLLSQACPAPQQNYTCAIYYYLSHGYAANLLGYTIGGAYEKYTISSINTSQPNLGLFASLSQRMGGAIDSLIYRNFEYINAWDHSRNMAISAVTKYGECYEISESGSIKDAQTNHSSSNVLNISANESNIITTALPSFYMPAGSCVSDDGCGCARNKVNVSNYKIEKNIYLKYGYQSCFWINYVSTVTIPQNLEMIRIRAPIVSVNSELNTFWHLMDNGNGEIFPLSIDGSGGTYKAGNDGMGQTMLIQSTNDTKHAISVMPVFPQQTNGGIWIENKLGLSNYSANATSTQYLEYVFTNVTAGMKVHLNSIICIGTIEDVQMCTGFGHN